MDFNQLTNIVMTEGIIEGCGMTDRQVDRQSDVRPCCVFAAK